MAEAKGWPAVQAEFDVAVAWGAHERSADGKMAWSRPPSSATGAKKACTLKKSLLGLASWCVE